MRTIRIAALAAATCPALGADDARLAALYEADIETLSLSLNRAPSVTVSAQTQFQYNLNLRDDDALGDDDTTLGFVMRRTRVNVAGPVTENIKGKVQIEFNAGTGDATLLEAFADWRINDSLSLRIGQQKVHFLREDSVGTVRMLTSDYSVQNRTFGQGYSQFVEAWYTRDNWRAWASFSDGFGSLNTNFNNSHEADYAFTGRAEFRFGDAPWSAFDQFTSWRGSASGANLGLAAHYQSTGSTNPALTDDASLLTLAADLAWVSDGWNAYVSGVWARSDDGTDEFDDFGVMAQAGVFVADRVELFGRWDGVFVDSDRGAGVSDFHTLTAGFNYYLVPESHAAKFTVNLLYYFDAVDDTGGVVGPSAGYNLLADPEDGQIGVTAQLQILF